VTATATTHAGATDSRAGNPSPRNAITVDVEDYFQVEAFAGVVDRSSWDSLPSRVEANVDRILELFAAADVCGTFFTLGWVAERRPAMVRRIVASGHELASHGYGHGRVDRQDPASFADDIRRARSVLEDVSGVRVIGYRAPTFSISRRNQWAFRVLEDEGYRYSSSVFPIRHDLYGDPEAPRGAYRPSEGALWEIPMTTVRLFGRNYPCAGGGYFRLMPYALFRAGLRRFHRIDRLPGMFYFHPWEIDPGQPRIPGASARARIRHYLNLAAMSGRLQHLLRDFTWGRVDQVFGHLLTA
jgi:polysaccharide deacetylase family protein (PEP-CTERM system associated)